LHQRTKFRNWSDRCGDIPIFVIFKKATVAILDFQKFEILTVVRCKGTVCAIMPYSSKSVKRLQRYSNLTVFKIAAVRQLGFVKFNFLTVGKVNRPILHQCTKFRKDRSNLCGDIAIFVISQDDGRRHLGFKNSKF